MSNPRLLVGSKSHGSLDVSAANALAREQIDRKISAIREQPYSEENEARVVSLKMSRRHFK
jgi:hypothetical protein